MSIKLTNLKKHRKLLLDWIGRKPHLLTELQRVTDDIKSEQASLKIKAELPLRAKQRGVRKFKAMEPPKGKQGIDCSSFVSR